MFNGLTFKTVRGQSYPILQASDAQSGATDLTLVAAPGANKRIVVLSAFAQGSVARNGSLNGGSVAFSFTIPASIQPLHGSSLSPLYICNANTALVADSTDAGANTTSWFVTYIVLDDPELN